MHSSPTLAAYVVLVMGLISMLLLVEAKLPNTKVVVKPACDVGYASKRYNNYAIHLLDFLVDETKNMYKNKDGSYTYCHSYPDLDSGSANGVGNCGRKLKKLDCWSCLRNAKDKLKLACPRAVGGNITHTDCSISFNRIP